MTTLGQSGTSRVRTSSGRLRTPAERISDFLDRNPEASRSSLRSKNSPYDPTHSWDARSDNQHNDHNLARCNKEVPLQHTRPIALIGSAVVLMEKNTDGLAGICVSQDSNKTTSTIPLTIEQGTIGMRPNLDKFSIPVCETAAAEQNRVVEAAPLSFQKMKMVAPTFVSNPEPSYYKACGPQLDQKLLTPGQRREILEYEKKKSAADVYIRQAMSDRGKTKKLLTSVDYQRGVVGYDNAVNPESEIYGKRARGYHSSMEKKEIVNDMRRGYLNQKVSAMEHSGNILNPNLMNDNVRTEKFYQNKGGDIHAPTFKETYFRVLESNKEVKKHNLERTQYLRDQDLNGKNYNIITHTDISQWPSKANERVHRSMMHPSQTSLEGPRNTQGSIIASAHLMK